MSASVSVSSGLAMGRGMKMVKTFDNVIILDALNMLLRPKKSRDLVSKMPQTRTILKTQHKKY